MAHTLQVGDRIVRTSTGRVYLVCRMYVAAGTEYISVRIERNGQPFGRVFSLRPQQLAAWTAAAEAVR